MLSGKIWLVVMACVAGFWGCGEGLNLDGATDDVDVAGGEVGGGEWPEVCEELIGSACDDGAIYAGDFQGNHYYILSTDQGKSAWSTHMSNAGAKDREDGWANTEFLLGLDGETVFSAVKLCAELVSHGREDWFLPAEKELNFLYENWDEIGLAASGFYWSSTELVFMDAVAQSFDTGTIDGSGKNIHRNVRCVRKAMKNNIQD